MPLARTGWAWWLLTLLAATGSGGCALPDPEAETARAWGEGPARWLLLPDETAELRAVRSHAELSGFLQRFWIRRDDDPQSEEIPFGRVFAERVAAADRLYAEPGVRGSLTDRGGALVLLGPPTILRASQRRTPAPSGNPPGGVRPTHLMQLEIWAYLPRDLAPALRSLLGVEDHERQPEITLTFAVGSRHTRLLDGRPLLELAARALVCERPPCQPLE